MRYESWHALKLGYLAVEEVTHSMTLVGKAGLRRHNLLQAWYGYWHLPLSWISFLALPVFFRGEEGLFLFLFCFGGLGFGVFFGR